MSNRRYTIAIDFDGVLHAYTTPWKNARTISDPPVPGAMQFLDEMSEKFDVAIYSTRSHQWFGRRAMKAWLRRHLTHYFFNRGIRQGAFDRNMSLYEDERAVALRVKQLLGKLRFPRMKPAALIYIDDRAWRFEGTFPTSDEIHRARPWNKPDPKGGRS
jgi:hypothetical protein